MVTTAASDSRLKSATSATRNGDLDENDVILIDAIEGLDLQADRPPHLGLELAQGGGFLVQEAIHDVLMGEYQQLTAGELSALSHNLAKDLVAHRFRSADEAAPLAAWTRLAQQVFQTLAGALAGHLHQPQRREADDVGLGAVTGESAFERGEHRAPVRLVAHVDEVDDDDAAEISQPQLPRDAHRRLEIRAEDGLHEVAVADVRPGVDIDRGHGLGLIDHQVSARLQRHLAIERPGHLLLDTVQIKQWSRPGIRLDDGRGLRHEGGGKLAHARELARRVDQYPADAA